MSATLLARSRVPLHNVPAYVALPDNQLARLAAGRLSEPMPHAALVSLIGNAGVGKSHLCQLAAQQLLKKRPSARFLFLPAVQIVDTLKRAADANRLAEFHRFARSLHAVIAEDLQEIAADPHGQRLFNHLLDELLESGQTAVMITLQRAPGELTGLSARLVNRCHGGLCVTLRSPGVDGRVELARQLTVHWKNPLTSHAMNQLAQRSTSPGQLCELLKQLQPLWERLPKDSVLEQLWPADPHPGMLSLWQVTQAVSEEFGISVDDLRSRSRSAGLVLPRQCAMYLARKLTPLPLGQIGDYFGHRNHTTVLHGCDRLEARLEETPTLRQQVRRLRKSLQKLRKADPA